MVSQLVDFDQILGETVEDSTGNHNGTLLNLSPDARTIGIDDWVYLYWEYNESIYFWIQRNSWKR